MNNSPVSRWKKLWDQNIFKGNSMYCTHLIINALINTDHTIAWFSKIYSSIFKLKDSSKNLHSDEKLKIPISTHFFQWMTHMSKTKYIFKCSLLSFISILYFTLETNIEILILIQKLDHFQGWLATGGSRNGKLCDI